MKNLYLKTASASDPSSGSKLHMNTEYKGDRNDLSSRDAITKSQTFGNTIGKMTQLLLPIKCKEIETNHRDFRFITN